MTMHRKILLILVTIGIGFVAMLYSNRQILSEKPSSIDSTDALKKEQLAKTVDHKNQSTQMKKTLREKIRKGKGMTPSGLVDQSNEKTSDQMPDEEYIKQRIAKVMEAHRQRMGEQKEQESPEEKAERKRKKKLNAQILNNLVGVESTFFAFGRAVDMSIVSGIGEDAIFYEFLEDFERQALQNPVIAQTTDTYMNTFLGTLEGIESTNVVMTDFQCGQASCIASFNSYDNDDWSDFIRLRKEFFNEKYPANTYVEYPQIVEEGTTLHRIFFSINGNIDGFYESGGT